MSRPLDGRRVLVVGEDFFNAMGVTTSLQIAGAQVVGPILDVKEALSQIQKDGFEVAVIDADLPNRDAVSISSALSAHDVPVVILSKTLAADDLIDALVKVLVVT
jgi:PleD family two-component response regulator